MTDDNDSERQRRVDRFNWHCEREARIAGVPRDHQVAVVRAGLAFVFERLLDKLIDTGNPTDLNAFVKLSELELQFAPKAPPPQITIVFSDEKPASSSPSSDAPSPDS